MRGPALSRRQMEWISRADTFFIGSRHAEGGVDASHRGGQPGFVQCIDERTLEFPDYAGNRMFQTLGNLVLDPTAGLLFVDFERGHTLQIAGAVTIEWSPGNGQFPGAERIVT